MLRLLLLIAGLAVGAAAHAQQEWPARPISLLVAFPAGGSDDILARLVAPRLAERLGQPVTVQNVSGQGGVAGGLRVAKAPADGYLLMLGTSATHALSQVLQAKPAYDALEDFTPIGLIAEQPFVVIARRDVAAATLAELAALSRATAAGLRYTSAGAGSATHLVCEVLGRKAGIEARHEPRNGGLAALAELVAGRADFFCPVVTIAVPEVAAGRVKAIAALGPRRVQALPGISTAREQGVEGLVASTWFALFAPRGVPEPVVQRLRAALDAALEEPALRTELERISAEAVSAERRSPQSLTSFLRLEIDKWRAALAAPTR